MLDAIDSKTESATEGAQNMTKAPGAFLSPPPRQAGWDITIMSLGQTE